MHVTAVLPERPARRAILQSRRRCQRGSRSASTKTASAIERLEAQISMSRSCCQTEGNCEHFRKAIAWLAKEILKSEHKTPKVQAAARMVTEAAENNGPMIFARMGVSGIRELVARKLQYWGKRKLKRDEP
jgi:transposase InsO family protein